ncbi:M48 family metalloprotease [Novosphingobium sp.]|uniref:M48 family metalloprotease n=1 Tax=Novosphingobium sp. TaxID=1874826 RepID=UPI0025D5D654|nr:M48 family metalloprotease [Novosphingobium sp.]MCC6926075.1 M48 family metalloprotease [Novosphingobium sp.]
MQFSRLSKYTLGAAVVLALVPQGLVAQAVQTVQAISQKDKDEGAKAHPQLTAQFGGAMTGPQADYVIGVGKKISVQSGLSNSTNDFTVTMLNSSVNNAFAIPGGFVYTTRQLVALMNNEAELAGVMGHEVGHVAARHSAKRQSAATKNSVIGIGGAILAGVLLGNNSQVGQILQKGFLQGSQLLTLKYSRKQENEADALGIQYLRKAGYDPRAMSTVLQSLANQNALDARMMGTSDQVPEWASTHPDPAARVRTTQALAGTAAKGTTNRDLFLTKISGMIYGDSPEQGYVEGRSFKHPVEKMAFEAPAGFFLVNGTQAVAIGGQGGKGQFTTAQFNGDLDAYVRAVFNEFGQANQAQLAPGNISRTTVNGIQAATAVTRVASGSGQVDVTVFAYQWDATHAYHFVTITQAGSNPFQPMFASMKRLSAAEVAALKPRKLLVVTVKKGDTVQSLASRMAYSDAPLDRFRVLNGLPASQTALTVGQKVKIVTY